MSKVIKGKIISINGVNVSTLESLSDHRVMENYSVQLSGKIEFMDGGFLDFIKKLCIPFSEYCIPIWIGANPTNLGERVECIKELRYSTWLEF